MAADIGQGSDDDDSGGGDILEGDSNAKYFHLVANGKHRKTRIFQLHDGDQVINGDANLKAHITTYYKGLFGPPNDSDIPQVSLLENEALTQEFTEKEIKEAIFQMEHNKALGPDGFPAEFYQVFWNVIKFDLLELFKDFHSGCLTLFSLNFGTIILLPKCIKAMKIQQYRPICLLNVSFKIFTKVATNRIMGVAQKEFQFILGSSLIKIGKLLKKELRKNLVVGKGDDHKKKYRLTRWDIICQPKDQGGLGIHNLEIQNKCFLSKWLYKLINEEGVWQDLLKRKYLYNKSITQVEKKQGDSHFWSELMKVKNTFLDMGSWIVNDGEQIRFLEDKWLGNLALKDKYPSLYAIVRRRLSSIATVIGSVPLNVAFRRALVGQNLVYWHELCASIVHIQLNRSSDCFRWNYHQNGRFSVAFEG
uniref:Retrotransposon protein, putative, unclassified n=1 Tax=Oryza sativa subsp. japonica TaxID=39947 RepID=Q84QY1_ORYSJ|nr:hypothetical protein [Oryza sativa Japonica Group]